MVPPHAIARVECGARILQSPGVWMGILAFADFEVDLDLFELRRRGKAVEISAKVFDLLLYLIRNRERVVTKDELLAEVWHAQALSSSAIPTAVLALRKVLGDSREAPRFVENTPGRGYRFIGEVCESLAEPRRGARGSETRRHSGFVGRVPELAAITSAFDRCSQGAPQMILLSGEAGIGKTRTADEFAERGSARGALVLVGRCREGEGAPAFWPWVQIVRGLVENLASMHEAAVRRLAPVLAQMTPEIRDRFPDLESLPPLDAEAARFRLFEAVTRLLQKGGSDQSLVIVLDDLHRADPASLHLLTFVARELREAAVLLLVTYRDVEARRDPPRLSAITELARQEPSRSILLQGLSPGEVAEFVAISSLRDAGSDALARDLHEQSGGNPFFLTQLVHVLEAEGSETLNDGTSVPVSLPGGVREAIAKQLDGLSDDTRRALCVAAAIGREFTARAVADVMALAPRALIATLRPAVDARLVLAMPDRIGHFRFAHVLLRDSVYERLDSLERIDLHLRIAETLEHLHTDDLGPHAAEIAYHFREAVHGGGAASAISYAIRAGEWSSARLAYEDAVRHYRGALGMLGTTEPGNPVQRCQILLALGEAEMNAGERDRAREVLYEAGAQAKRARRPDLLARAALRLAPGFFTIEIGVFDVLLVKLLEDAIEALGPTDSPTRAQLLARLAMAHGWTGAEEKRGRLTADAIGVAERVADPGALAYALSAKHSLLWGPEGVRERVALIDRMGALAAESRDPELILMHLLFRITSGLELGRVEQLDRDVAAYVRIAESLKEPQSLWYAQSIQAARSLMKGKFAEAAIHAERLLAIGGRIHDVNAFNSFGIHAAIQLWEKDRTAEVLPFADQYVETYPLIPGWQFSRAFMYFESGQVQTARVMFDILAQNDFARIPRNEQWSIAITLAADLCCRLDDEASAETLYAQLLPAASLYCVIGFGVAYLGSIALRLAMLASTCKRWETADRHFADAIRMEEATGSLPWLTHSLYWFAKSNASRESETNLAVAAAACERGIELATTLELTHLNRKLRHFRRFVLCADEPAGQ